MNEETLKAIEAAWEANAQRANAGSMWQAVDRVLEANKKRAEAQKAGNRYGK